MKEHRYFVYILASRSHNFYIGVTNSLRRRVLQHKNHVYDGFTARYNIDRLVYYAIFNDIRNAIAREKQLKRWRREKKIQLIENLNPTWQDLSEGWYDEPDVNVGVTTEDHRDSRRTADPSTRTGNDSPGPRSG